jgi:hypothetical protein
MGLLTSVRSRMQAWEAVQVELLTSVRSRMPAREVVQVSVVLVRAWRVLWDIPQLDHPVAQGVVEVQVLATCTTTGAMM